MRFLLKHIELVLSAAGLVVIAVMPMLFGSHGEQLWKIASITAICVGLIHGLIFWLIRQRQRNVREQTLADVRGMLKDVLNNHLTVILCNASLTKPLTEDDLARLTEIQTYVTQISANLDSISEESLRKWQTHYASMRDTPASV